MQRRESTTITGTSDAWEKGTILRGRPGRTRTVQRLLITEVTDTLQGDATIGVWKNNTKVQEFPYAHLLDDNGSNARHSEPSVPLDIPLESDDDLQVGHESGGTASDIAYTAVYREESR